MKMSNSKSLIASPPFQRWSLLLLLVVLLVGLAVGTAVAAATGSFSIGASGLVAGERFASGSAPCLSASQALTGPFTIDSPAQTGLDNSGRIDSSGRCLSYDYNEHRFAVEFSLADLPQGCDVTAATVGLFTSAPVNAGQTKLTAYVGDGTPTLSELEMPSGEGSTYFTPSGDKGALTAVDITTLVQAVVAQSATHVGFVVQKDPLEEKTGSIGQKAASWDGPGDSLPPALTVEWACAANEPPTADAGGPYLVAVGNTISLDGTGTDPEGQTVTYQWAATAGSLNDATQEDPLYTAGNEAGIFEVSLTVTDPGGLTGSATAMVVVYDPSAGFVTGGGWIDSPAGAYTPDPDLTGRANFGFVSKYKKGASTPSGNTEFQFQAGNLNFHSSTYEWLVVNQGGSNAQFKGQGTINGANDANGNPYNFMLWATDGAPDTFRIRIWWEDGGGEHDVYDNGDGGSPLD
ncbi:MAG TPA: PKD domain-containing protein, partial [Anaerolineae bacterium]